MKNQLSRQISIAQHIIDGSITIDSLKEFRSMLQIFPNDPGLRRVYADLLINKQKSEAAASAYHQAASLFVAAGLMLQAVVCWFLKGQIKKPADTETKKFWKTLHKCNYHEIPTHMFFASLSHAELVDVMHGIRLIRLPAGKTITQVGKAEHALYFIVGGSIKATADEPLNKTGSNPHQLSVYLSENDFFGNIYPLNQVQRSYYHTEAISPTELVRISRETLRQVCRRHPRLELAIIDLFKVRSEKEDMETLRAVRRTNRQKLPFQMNLKIWPGADGHYGLILDGLCRDISVDGMCIVLDAKYANVPSMFKSIQNAKIEISMPSEAMTINVLGSIVWSKEVYIDQERTFALGIRFEEMSPQMSGLLLVFANLINKSSH